MSSVPFLALAQLGNRVAVFLAPRVVIIGAGFGGLSAAKALEHMLSGVSIFETG